MLSEENETEENETATEDALEYVPVYTGELVEFLDPTDPHVVKYANIGEYEIFTLDLVNDDPFGEEAEMGRVSCDGFRLSECINVIRKNDEIIRHNIPRFYRDDENFGRLSQEVVGPLYELTENGVIFRYIERSEGMPCGGYIEYAMAYCNFPTQKMLYGIYSEREEGVSPDPEDTFCQHPDSTRTLYTDRKFYDTPDFYSEALGVQANDMESAFYIYVS